MSLKSKRVIICNDIKVKEDTGWHVNIDADPIVYRVAWACQKTVYELKGPDGVINSSNTKVRALGDDYKGWTDAQLEEAGLSLEKSATTDQWDAVVNSIHQQINQIIHACQAESYDLFLTGKGNYRADIATRRKYKAGRSEKPLLYSAIREYMVETLGATVYSGYEADDALSAASWTELRRIKKTGIKGLDKQVKESRVILASIDKDLRQVPGWYYNPMWGAERKPEMVTKMGYLSLTKGKTPKLEFAGLKGFYAQMLLGDSVDAIPGVDGIGPVGAYELLDDCTNEEELYTAVLEAATMSMGRKVEYFHWSDMEDPDVAMTKQIPKLGAEKMTISIEDYLKEQANLLYMLRKLPKKGKSPKLWKCPIKS